MGASTGAGTGSAGADSSTTGAGSDGVGVSAAGGSAAGGSAAGTSIAGGSGASATGSAAGSSGAGAGSAAFFLDDFLAAAGSSGCWSRIRPSRSALRRTRSAWASSIPDECVLTPIPSSSARSRVSLLVRPSSFASSWTRIFAANVSSPALLSCGCVRECVPRRARTHKSRAPRVPGTKRVRVASATPAG